MNAVDQRVVEEAINNLDMAQSSLMYASLELYGISSDFGPISLRIAEAMTQLDEVLEELRDL